MPTYRISNTTSGHTLGDYEADSQEAALDAMSRDAGYRDHAHACDVTGNDGSDLLVEQVEASESAHGLTRDQAIEALAADPTLRCSYRTRDATRQWWIEVPCRLEAGELVQPHPTDPPRGPIAAPADARFSVRHPTTEELEWERYREEQERRESAAERGE